MLTHFMKVVCTSNRGHMIHNLEKANVNLLNCTELQSVVTSSVKLVNNVSRTVPDPYVTWSLLLQGDVKNPLARKIKVEEGEQRWRLIWWI
jgi:2-enoate reductase